MTKVTLPILHPSTTPGFGTQFGGSFLLPSVQPVVPEPPRFSLNPQLLRQIPKFMGQKPATGGLIQQTLKPALNQFGSQIGFGSGLPIARPIIGGQPLVGPLPLETGVLGTTTTLSGALGGAGLGGLFGALNPLAKNQTTSTIGGALGGAIGSIVPGIGTVVGGIAGSLLGGLFGGGKKHPEASFAFNVMGDGSVTNPQFLAKHFTPEHAAPLATLTQTLVRGLQQQDVDLSDQIFQGGVTPNNAFFQRTNKETGEIERILFDPNNTEEISRATIELTEDILKDIGDSRKASELVANISASITGVNSFSDIIPRDPSGVPLIPQRQVRRDKETFSDFIQRIRG